MRQKAYGILSRAFFSFSPGPMMISTAISLIKSGGKKKRKADAEKLFPDFLCK